MERPVACPRNLRRGFLLVASPIHPSLKKNRRFSDAHHSRIADAVLYISINLRIETPMSDMFINWASRVAIAGRIGERLRPQGNDFTLRGDYHRPFGKSEARAEAVKWLCQV